MKATALINIRSAHNVGSIVRSAAFFGIDTVICVGVTPHPAVKDDDRLPHIIAADSRKISKVALGGEKHVTFEYMRTVDDLFDYAGKNGLPVLALEQSSRSTKLETYSAVDNYVVCVGEETKGLDENTINRADVVLEIKGSGIKESLNVSTAAGIAYAYLNTK